MSKTRLISALGCFCLASVMTQSHGAESTLKTRVTVNDLLPSDDEYEKQRQSLCILLSEALFGEASDDILFGVAVRELWHWYNICFPSHTVKASQFASIFDQTKPLNIHFSSTTFNTSYASEGIFNRYSAAIVYLLVQGIKSHAREPNLLNRVLGFCGVARAALDLVSNKKTLTDFGKLVEPNNYLQEEWQQYPEGYRLFLITNFNSIQVDPELFVDSKLFDRARGPVKHSPQGYLDASPFFGVLCISANNGILDTEALLKFIYYFARSSTFSRGQATMGEWITSALLILSHLQMQLCSFTTHEVLTLNDIYRSHPEEVITVLCKNMSTLPGRLSHCRTFSSLIKEVLTWRSTVYQVPLGTIFPKKLVSHLFRVIDDELNKMLLNITSLVLKNLQNDIRITGIDSDELINAMLSSLLMTPLTLDELHLYPTELEQISLKGKSFIQDDIVQSGIRSVQMLMQILQRNAVQLKIKLPPIWEIVFSSIVGILSLRAVTASKYETVLAQVDNLVTNFAAGIHIKLMEAYLDSVFSHLDVIALDCDTEDAFLKICKKHVKFVQTLQNAPTIQPIVFYKSGTA